ncbi:Dicer-like protein 1 [Tulasnella sp. 418]|nr:Dicer-like protein 1 [Tulasnella sp. 418]
MWDSDRWRSEIGSHDILVMTPEILVRLLTHARMTMDQISLLVMDEAHHCRGNHPYARVMREHYAFAPADRRPKVFGLTASPVWNPKNPQKGLRELEKLMDCTIISVERNADELKAYSPRAVERLAIYEPSPFNYADEMIASSLWGHLSVLDEFKNHVGDDGFADFDRRYVHASISLGLYAADYYLHQSLSQSLSSRTAAAKSVRDVLRRHEHRFVDSSPVRLHEQTPKVRKLVEILNLHRSESLQAIIFVRQRQVARALSWLLAKIPTLEWVRSESIVGHSGNDMASRGIAVKVSEKVVAAFREKRYNVLVASSVAEEGLDFPTLNLVIRFDTIDNMVSFAQSRGRARHYESIFYAMIASDDVPSVDKYHAFSKNETIVKRLWADSTFERDNEAVDDDDDVPTEEELSIRYITKVGAILTCSGAIPLLSELCSLLPVDGHTQALKPVYTGGFTSVLTLPSALPIPRSALSYVGPECSNKKQAKRMVAFNAVQTLHQLGVFDDSLLPVRESRADDGEDADGRKVRDVSAMKDVERLATLYPFDNPWRPQCQLWLQPLLLHGKVVCGLVSSSNVFINSNMVNSSIPDMRLERGVPLRFPSDEVREAQLDLMDAFTIEGFWWGISTKKILNRELSVFLILVKEDTLTPDFERMEQFLNNRTYLWTPEMDLHAGSLLARHRRRHSPLLFSTIREDLTPLSKPMKTGSRFYEEGFETYLEYYTKPNSYAQPLPVDPNDVMLEFKELKRARTTIKVSRKTQSSLEVSASTERYQIIPRSAIAFSNLPIEVFHAFTILPAVIRSIIGHYRAQGVQSCPGIPPLIERRLVESLTLPCVEAGFDYQRLETLGDSCLKLATSIHVFTKYPHKHEGQLHALRRNSISNRYLRGRAFERQLHRYVSCERVLEGKSWIPPKAAEVTYDGNGQAIVQRDVPLKAMQDCMEAILGVAYLSGGMPHVLKTGTALNLCFGGPEIWPNRFPVPDIDMLVETPPGLQVLEIELGYTFRNPWLLMESMTHPSFTSQDTASYNRLEFLGDALVEQFFTHHLFHKYPLAPPGKLTNARCRAVCNTTLAAVAIKRLSLDKTILHSSATLSEAMAEAREILENIPYKDIVRNTWKYSPPKALGDLTESILGAVFVDSHYDLGLMYTVLERVVGEVLMEVHPNVPEDPVSELMIYVSRHGCTKVKIQRGKPEIEVDPELGTLHTAEVVIHGTQVGRPVTMSSLSLARAFVSEQVLENLQNGEIKLEDLCTCAIDMEEKDREEVEKLLTEGRPNDEDIEATEKSTNDDTEEGFRRLADLQIRKLDVHVEMEEELKLDETNVESQL